MPESLTRRLRGLQIVLVI